MPAPKVRVTKSKLISSTRPKRRDAFPKLSSRRSRHIIQSHHTRNKQIKQAEDAQDEAKKDELLAQMEEAGGLSLYQQASLLGQHPDRGGDSSKVLVAWLLDSAPSSDVSMPLPALRVLEIGALQINNAIARHPQVEIERIDLHSQHPLIAQQDFMKRPKIPAGDLVARGFDIISLSLVLNFVDNAAVRGDMLRHTTCFLRHELQSGTSKPHALAPALFLVLPAPTLSNSRYLDEPALELLMSALGYTKVRSKWSPRLVYYLWQYRVPDFGLKVGTFKKGEVRSGRTRNNFAIVLK